MSGEVMTKQNNEYLTPRELSELYKISLTKLAIDRMNNVGFPYVKEKNSSIVRYPMSAVQEHIQKNMKLVA